MGLKKDNRKEQSTMRKLALSILPIYCMFCGSLSAQNLIPPKVPNYSEIEEILWKYHKDDSLSALNKAIEAEDYRSAMALIHYGVNVSRRGSCYENIFYTHHKHNRHQMNEGKTPLELAVEKNNLELISLLLIKGAKPYVTRGVSFFIGELNFGQKAPKNYNDNNDMYYTITTTEGIKATIVHSVAYGAQTCGLLTTAISDAILKNNADIIEVFCSHGVDLNDNCINLPYWHCGLRPLDFAMLNNKTEAARVLISYGALPFH